MNGSRQILSRIWRPLLKRFGEMIDRACLRRDAYLDKVLSHEARMLEEEVPCRNSPLARAYLQRTLEALDRVPVNFSLTPATIDAVNRACEGRNVIRDCFVNRVLFLLLAKVDALEVITGLRFREDLGEILGDNDRHYLYAPLWNGGLRAVFEVVSSDPFWALRNLISWYRSQGHEDAELLHACLILPELFPNKPAGVLALNCHLPDAFIPGTAAANRAHQELEELLGQAINTKSETRETKRRRNRRG